MKSLQVQQKQSVYDTLVSSADVNSAGRAREAGILSGGVALGIRLRTSN